MRKKVNLPNKVLKEIKNLHAIIVERLVTHQINAGVMEKKNLMKSVTIATNMDTKPMNARRNQNLKVNVTNAKGMVTECRSKSFNPAEQLVKEIFRWDYNT